jgi:hypothetical protein
MRRHWSRRLVAALLAVWFVAARVEHSIGPCLSHMAMPGMDMAGMAHGRSPAAPDRAPPHAPDQNCLSCCCGPTVLAPPPAPPCVAVVAVAPIAPAWSGPHQQAPAARADFVLPFATAPPVPTPLT